MQRKTKRKSNKIRVSIPKEIYIWNGELARLPFLEFERHAQGLLIESIFAGKMKDNLRTIIQIAQERGKLDYHKQITDDYERNRKQNS